MPRWLVRAALLVAVTVASWPRTPSAQQQPTADLLLVNAKVITVDPRDTIA
jgi:hypothetical protein